MTDSIQALGQQTQVEAVNTAAANDSSQPTGNVTMEDAVNTDQQHNDIFDEIEMEYAKLRELTTDQVMALKFDTHNAAVAWYKKYGRTSGFDTRLHSMRCNRDGDIIERYIRCRAQGHWKRKKDSDTDLGPALADEPKKRGENRGSPDGRPDLDAKLF